MNSGVPRHGERTRARMGARMQLAPLIVAAALLLAACAVHPAGSFPRAEECRPPNLPAAFTLSGDAGGPERERERVRMRWWTAFEDPVLDGLVETALGKNFDLKSARERVIQAAALARRAGAPLRPQVDGTASAGGVTTRRDLGAGTTEDTAEALSLGARASWELDLWGGLRAGRDAAVWEARAGRADLDAARISISAQVASAWYRYTEESRIAGLLEEQIETNEKLLTLIEARFQRGQGAAADVLRQQQLVERIRGDLSLTRGRRAVFGHQLMTLQGLPAAEAPPPAPPSLIALPPLPALGVPSEVLNRRPDVKAAWWRVHAADRDLATAIADRYPRVALSAAAVVGGAGLEVFFIDRLASIAADLVAPLVDGGARRAQVEADAAVTRQRLHEYTQAVLEALQEVEDALVEEVREREHLESLERQHVLAKRVVETLLTRYGQGASAYLDVLAAIQSEQSLAVSLVSSRRQLIEHRISLCRAIAGAWTSPRADCATPPPEAGDDCGHASHR